MIMTDHHAATAPLMSALTAAVCPVCKIEEADTVFLSTALNFANQTQQSFMHADLTLI